MNKIFLTLFAMTLGGCNAAYVQTVNKQLAEGYRWVEIPCRPAKPDVPSITMDTPDNKKLVCNVLQKQFLLTGFQIHSEPSFFLQRCLVKFHFQISAQPKRLYNLILKAIFIRYMKRGLTSRQPARSGKVVSFFKKACDLWVTMGSMSVCPPRETQEDFLCLKHITTPPDTY